MSKVNLIRKTELQLLDNINNFNNILSYISNNSSGKLSEIVNLVKNIANEKRNLANIYLNELKTIMEEIKVLELKNNNYHNDILNLNFKFVFLFVMSLLAVIIVSNFFVITNLYILNNLFLFIFNGYNIIRTYHDYKEINKCYADYKNKSDILNKDFNKKYVDVIEKSMWFEVVGNYLLNVIENNKQKGILNEENVKKKDKIYSLIKK